MSLTEAVQTILVVQRESQHKYPGKVGLDTGSVDQGSDDFFLIIFIYDFVSITL